MLRTTILESRVEFIPQPFAVPLVLSSGPITECTEARATVAVEVDGNRATGRGAIYLSDLWSWPDHALSHGVRDAALRRVCQGVADDLWQCCGGVAAHPLELGMRLHEAAARGTGVTPGPPELARIMCASPFDAAIHDAVGQALGRSAFSFYADPAPMPLADACFEGGLACQRIARLIQPPKRELGAWCIVGKNETHQTLRPWVQRGYRQFKVRTLGKDNGVDVARTVEVFRMAEALGARNVVLSIDANEGSPDAASVEDYLLRLRSADARVFAAVQYLEQPTSRDILAHPYDWRGVAALKPVMLDEGLTRPDLMVEAMRQGWSGLAIKTCKGHSFSLIAAAWAREHHLLVACQDLTNPGFALIHSALLAAHVPTINDVELNSPQFTPAANSPWLPRLAELFEPTAGMHRLPERIPVGLGSGI